MSLFCSRCGSKNRPDASKCEKCDSRIGHLPGDTETSPESHRSESNASFKWIATGLICLLYLVYPSLGIFELIPDATPVIGSMDEAAATAGLILSLSRLGFSFWK